MGGRGEKVGCICEVKTQNEKIWGESVSIHFPEQPETSRSVLSAFFSVLDFMIFGLFFGRVLKCPVLSVLFS